MSENDKPKDDDKKPDEKPDDGKETKPTDTKDPIIFDLPYENAKVQKEYAENKLLYDATTGFWCTHQAIDFVAQEGVVAKAVFDGKITKIENSMMYGTVVYLQISDDLVVRYKGLGSDVMVKEGDTVKKGQNIGKITAKALPSLSTTEVHELTTK